MALQISTTANYHWVQKISARTNGGAALKLVLQGDPAASPCQFNEVEINVFMEDAAMVDRLIEAINGVSCEMAWVTDASGLIDTNTTTGEERA